MVPASGSWIERRWLELTATADPQPVSGRSRLQPTKPPPLSNKIARGIWLVAYFLMFRFVPSPFHGWRRFVLALFGAEVESGARIYPSCQIWAPWNLKLGRRCVVGPGADLYSVDMIIIGDEAVVSQKAFLCTASHDFASPSFDLVTAPIRLEANCWVAADAFVGPGVTIGEGAVVGARSVVTKDVPARQLVAGNPARHIGTRPAEGRNVLE